MNSTGKPHRNANIPVSSVLHRSPVFRISKPFLSKFITASRSGEVHGFLGPNGAGKSTTLRVLLGLIRRDSGELSLLGGDSWRDAVALHRRLAYVPAVWGLVGVSFALLGLLPRLAASVGRAVLAGCVLIEEFGRPLRRSKRVLDLSPFAYVPKLPSDDVFAAPLARLALISAVFVAAGMLGLRRRDVL